MSAIAYGFAKDGATELRSAQISKTLVKHNFPGESIIYPSIYDALAGLLTNSEPEKCILVGTLGDTLPRDEEDVDPGLWVEVIMTYLESKHIVFYEALDKDDLPACCQATIPSQAVRNFHRAFEHLIREIDDRMEPKIIKKSKGFLKPGRPPYGYTKKGSSLCVDRHQAEAVNWIFAQIRDGATYKEVVDGLLVLFPRVGKTGQKQFWDHVKVRRILAKTQLYCRGEYQVADGSIVRQECLRILPADWVDTQAGVVKMPSKTKKPAKKRSRKAAARSKKSKKAKKAKE